MSMAELNEGLDPLDLFGGQANRLAADIQKQLAEMGLELERDFFSQLREDEAPVRDVRNEALTFLQQLQSGQATLPDDPSLGFQQQNAITDINKAAAAGGKSLAGGTRMAEQDALAQLQSQSTNNQLNRVLNLAGFETRDLLGQNSLIAQSTDSQANQMSNIGGINASFGLGRSNAIFDAIGQGTRLAGSVIEGRR